MATCEFKWNKTANLRETYRLWNMCPSLIVFCHYRYICAESMLCPILVFRWSRTDKEKQIQWTDQIIINMLEFKAKNPHSNYALNMTIDQSRVGARLHKLSHYSHLTEPLSKWRKHVDEIIDFTKSTQFCTCWRRCRFAWFCGHHTRAITNSIYKNAWVHFMNFSKA